MLFDELSEAFENIRFEIGRWRCFAFSTDVTLT